MPTTTASSTASKPKRVNTEARKIQNREAQRAYRRRQKERLKAQKETSGKRGVGGFKEIRPSPVVQILSATDEPGYDQGHDVGKHALDISYWNTDPIAPTVLPIGAPTFLTTLSPSTNVLEHDSPPDIGDIAPKDVMGDFDAIFPASTLTDFEFGTNFAPVEELLDSSLNDPPTASGANSSRTITHSQIQTAAFPSPTESRLTPHRTHLLTACLHNASSLGIAIDDFFTYNCMSLCSPFYRPSFPSTDPKSLLASVIQSNPFIPTHLRPTLPQILIPHHPIFDHIPMPRLRT